MSKTPFGESIYRVSHPAGLLNDYDARLPIETKGYLYLASKGLKHAYRITALPYGWPKVNGRCRNQRHWPQFEFDLWEDVLAYVHNRPAPGTATRRENGPIAAEGIKGAHVVKGHLPPHP